MKEFMKFDIEDRLINFGVRIIRLAQALPRTRVGTTSPGRSFEAAHPLLLIMARRRAPNLALIVSIGCRYASRNCVERGYGC